MILSHEKFSNIRISLWRNAELVEGERGNAFWIFILNVNVDNKNLIVFRAVSFRCQTNDMRQRVQNEARTKWKATSGGSMKMKIAQMLTSIYRSTR